MAAGRTSSFRDGACGSGSLRQPGQESPVIAKRPSRDLSRTPCLPAFSLLWGLSKISASFSSYGAGALECPFRHATIMPDAWYYDNFDSLCLWAHPQRRLISRSKRSEEHTSELQSLMRISYAVFCLKNKIHTYIHNTKTQKNREE